MKTRVLSFLLLSSVFSLFFSVTALAQVGLKVDSSGNVGIGTNSPGSMLSLGTASNPGELRLSGVRGDVIIRTYPYAGGSWTFTLPPDDGFTQGLQLTTNGAGNYTFWSAATSSRSMKNITGGVSPIEGLNQILGTPVYRFHYKQDMGTGDTETEYIGVLADEAPWAMHYKGIIVNPVNTLGYTILGIQALDEKIKALNISKLEDELAALKSEN